MMFRVEEIVMLGGRADVFVDKATPIVGIEVLESRKVTIHSVSQGLIILDAVVTSSYEIPLLPTNRFLPDCASGFGLVPLNNEARCSYGVSFDDDVSRVLRVRSSLPSGDHIHGNY